MLGALAVRLFGTANDRLLKPHRRTLAAANALEEGLRALDDDGLRAHSGALRALAAGGASLDALLPEAFALVREASRRLTGLRHHDVQLLGGMVLHAGGVAEMRTGEGKTLVATLPAYLRALAGKGVHVVTVNDYLARRDAETVAPLLEFLGVSVGVVAGGMEDPERRAAYAADVTYATNVELGFDYLRDNLKASPAEMVQRGHAYALVDEVDSILIDEARMPLIISGPGEAGSALHLAVDEAVARLGNADREVDEKTRTADLTEAGNERIEAMLREAGLMPEGTLYDAPNSALLHVVVNALKARFLFRRDKDYVVAGGEVVLVDPSTGRTTPGRRLSDGLHQAIEAKERVEIKPENRTLASITYQNYFRLYGTLSGMTGTAATEADELDDIYKLKVTVVPTNKPVARVDEDDEVYRTEAAKMAAVVAEVERAHGRMQPVLVGTASVESSERVAALLEAAGWSRTDYSDPAVVADFYAAAREGRPTRRFAVLNARSHEREAAIVAEAGVPGAVTIATSMAGRGTDIILGGNPAVRAARELEGVPEGPERDEAYAAIAAEFVRNRERVMSSGEAADPARGLSRDMPGGLYVIGCERHESRRVDNQLRGRSGRQGDPGRSRFHLSLEDELVRVFGSPRIDNLLGHSGVGENDAIAHPWVTGMVEKAQAKVEARNFNQRKEVLKYDDVIDAQRKVVFRQRREFMDGATVRDTVDEMRASTVEALLAKHVPEGTYAEQWDLDGLKRAIVDQLAIDMPVHQWAGVEGTGPDEMHRHVSETADAVYAQRMAANGPEITADAERKLLLSCIDHVWREHITALEHMRHAVGLRQIGQRDPLQEFRAEAYEMFQSMTGNLAEMVTANVNRVSAAPDPQPEPRPEAA